MSDPLPRPSADSAARMDRLLKSRITDGIEVAQDLLTLLGDLPVPGVDLKDLLKAKHRVSKWCKESERL